MEFDSAIILTDNTKPVHQELVNYYCDINLDTMCRVCLEKNQPNKKMCNIFEAIKPGHIYTMIMACASVQIMENDGLPNTICHKCMAKLNIAWQFKIQCENSDAKLRHFYSNSQHLQITPDLDGYNLSIKNEENLFTIKQDSAPTFIISNIPADVTKLNNISNEVIQEPKTEEKEDKQTKTTKRQGRRAERKEQKIHQCDTCGKTFNRREYLTQHIRIHTGEKPYRCHLCEKRFVNSGHLTTHMRTHTGERPHACTLCPKAFSTRQELQKHTMVHNGERPFVCKMCGKRFGSSSNLYSHLKHHTGEKNFTCEHCGKAFYTKQELKQHLVVHTGEKAFLCEFCNKRFSQVAHLRRHSKLHN